jgi:small subunit ribosomal protein S15Ae
MRINILADALNAIVNAERKGLRQVLLRPASKVLIKFLKQMQKHGYIGEFELIDDHRSNKIVVELLGRVNKCGVISPRFDINLENIERWITQILPSKQFGHLIVSTTYGNILTAFLIL